ncbi:NAD(P)/FAD-dependent oxidoreductase [Aquibacillus salsiterrae]|uniref:FAD-binding oxidoreductase n=1 Tax=Aquibacillus salsiterrae TaxID=2950439 RepID=A0A9X3WGQ7_9BACI|nr:FAD-binding oxidoreductase [Aquibacillus salsiterrae]MDC3417124.1 FAD-binding oxidoreductase [Aquibacillus salsiterrae]
MKIVVIGGGILGSSTTYHLAKSGAEVCLIDKHHQGQATDAAAGIVCPWLSQRRNKAWYTLAKSGASYYPHLIKELEADGETETGYRRVGTISIRKDKNKVIAMEERARHRRETAPEIGEISVLSKEQTSNLFPPLDKEFESIYISGGARVDGRKLRNSMQRAAEKNGATIIRGKAAALSSNANNDVNGVYVGDEFVEADVVIVTAGVWAKQFLEPLGIEFCVEPQKAQIAHVHLPDTDTSNWPVVMPPNDQYLLAFDDGHIVAGATHENDRGFDTTVTPIGIHEIFDKALNIAPGLAQAELIETRVGFRPVLPNFLPVIGPLPGFEQILVANGLGSSGLTTGPYLGSQLAKLALGMEIELDLNDYPVKEAVKWLD